MHRAQQVEIRFCCTNIDLHSLDEFNELECQGRALHVEHCLGLCHYCAQGKMAVVDDIVIVAETSEAFWQALWQPEDACRAARTGDSVE